MNRPGGRGRFVVLEGIEGAGKSSQIEPLRALLEGRGVPLLATREPGGTALSERIRALLLDPANQGMSHDAELLLVFAARAEHLARLVRPALESGTWVLCDRFTDSTYAYQGGGRGLDPRRIAVLEDLVQGGLRPDLTLVFDLPPALGLARAKGRGPADRFESERLQFFEQARAVYLGRARACPGRYAVVDASRPIDEVGDRVRAIVGALLDRDATGQGPP